MHYFKLIFAVGVIILNTCGTSKRMKILLNRQTDFQLKTVI